MLVYMISPEDTIESHEYAQLVESILEDAPLTKHFVRGSPLLPGWPERLGELMQPIGKKLEQDLGEDFNTRIIQPFLETTLPWGVFWGDRAGQLAHLGVVIAMGYELGDEQHAQSIRPQIIKQLLAINWVTPYVAVLPEHTNEVVDRTILGLLNVGVSLYRSHNADLMRELFGGLNDNIE